MGLRRGIVEPGSGGRGTGGGGRSDLLRPGGENVVVVVVEGWSGVVGVLVGRWGAGLWRRVDCGPRGVRGDC